MNKFLFWRFAAIHLVIIIIIATILFYLFAPTARLCQKMVGGLEPPERYATVEEAERWQFYLERGYGEGVNTVTNLLFFTLGIGAIGILTSHLILPLALKKDPGLDPTDIILPTCARSVGAGAILALLAAIFFDQAISGVAAVGLAILPAFAFAYMGMGLGVWLWKRRRYQAHEEDPTISDFYHRLRKNRR